MKKALLIVDIQNDYFPKGQMSLDGAEKAARNARKILEHFRKKEETILHIQHISVREGASFFLPGTWGSNIHESVKPLKEEIVIQKNFPNSFLHTPLLETLQKQQIKELIICGMMSQMCIDSTTRAASELGFACKLIHDACAAKDLEWNGYLIKSDEVHRTIMASLQGVFAEVIATEDYI